MTIEYVINQQTNINMYGRSLGAWVGGPWGRLDFVLRNDVVIGREDNRNVKKLWIVKVVEKYIKVVEKYKKVVEKSQNSSRENPKISQKDITNKSNKYRQQIQKISPTNPKNIITNKSENDHQQIQKFPNPNPSPPPFLFHYILLSVLCWLFHCIWGGEWSVAVCINIHVVLKRQFLFLSFSV